MPLDYYSNEVSPCRGCQHVAREKSEWGLECDSPCISCPRIVAYQQAHLARPVVSLIPHGPLHPWQEPRKKKPAAPRKKRAYVRRKSRQGMVYRSPVKDAILAQDPEWFRDKLAVEIGRHFKCSTPRIRQLMPELGITYRKKWEKK